MTALLSTGPGVDHLVLGLLGLTCGFLLLFAGRRWPIVLAVGYLAVMFFVPVWSGISVGVFLPPQILFGLLVLAVALSRGSTLGSRLTGADLVVGAFLLASLAPWLAGAAAPGSVSTVLFQYLVAYLVGRLLPLLVGLDRLLRVLAVGVTVLAVLTLAEYVTGVNVFQHFPGSASVHAQWGGIQLRGGVARAEGAFGHSIALGATLAMSVPLVLAAPLRPWLRVVVAVLATSAVVVTFSRIGLVAACIGLVLSVIAARDLPRRARALLAGSVLAVSVVAVPLLSRVFVAAGDEATNSAAYRGRLLSLVGDIDLLGLSSAFDRAASGEVRFDAFGSIDSALILEGLRFGWAALALSLLLLALAVGAVLRRRASAATIAIAAQVPALATVALITQYATMVWFVGGLAVCAQAARTRQGDAGAGDLPPSGDSTSEQVRPGITSRRPPLGGRVVGE